MSHPSNDALFSVAQGDDRADIAAHVAGCEACASRLRRLRGGAEAMREAKRSVPDISWSALDVVMAREAQSAAREMRLRPASDRPIWLRPFAFGAAFAAVGALAVAVVTLRTPPEAPPAPTASRVAPPSASSTPDRRPVEATVLLSTRGAVWRAGAGGASSRLTEGALREGARIETAQGDRAVLSLQRGVQMDLRGESLASLTRLREGESLVSLERGELRLARSGEGEVALRSGAWTVRVEGDLVARSEMSVVRVVLLAGRASVERAGAEAMTFSGPVTLELPLDGAPQVRESAARDERSLDLSAFDRAGSILDVPPLDPSAVLFVREDAPLPAGVTSVRLSHGSPLSARVGRALYTIEIGTGQVASWRRERLVAATAAPTPTRARPAPRALPAVAAVESPDPGLTPAQIRGVTRAAGMRIRHCFSTCVERNQCAADEGQLRIQVQTDGRASLAPIPASLEGARRCLENEMQAFRGVAAQAPYAIAIGFNTRR